MDDSAIRSLCTVLVSALLLSGCSVLTGDDEDVPPPPNTYLRASLNGEPWGVDARAILDSTASRSWLTIVADTLYEDHYPYREHLVLSVEYRGPGDYSLVERVRDEEEPLLSGSSYSEFDANLLLSRYSPTKVSATNQLTIAQYDTTTGIMTGTFRTVVVADDTVQAVRTQDLPPPRPDTIRFTDGELRVMVEDRRDQ